MSDAAKCSICHKGDLVQGIWNLPIRYKARKTFARNIQAKRCSYCGTAYFGPEDDEDERYMAALGELRQKVETERASKRAQGLRSPFVKREYSYRRWLFNVFSMYGNHRR